MAVVNESQKGPNNAYYAHENTRFYIGTDKLTFATFYRYQDQNGAISAFTEDNITNNPTIGYKNYKVPWGICGYQTYGVNRTYSTQSFLNSFARPYSGMKALVQSSIVNGILVTSPMCILNMYDGGGWKMPAAYEIRNQIYQAIVGGAKGLGYYTWADYGTTNLETVTADRRLEIKYCHDELSLRAFTSTGQRDGETYERHILTGTHSIHSVSGTGLTSPTFNDEGIALDPYVVAASWYLGTTKLVIITNRHPDTAFTNLSFRLDQGYTPLGVRHSGSNYSLTYAGLQRKKPTTEPTLAANAVTVNITSIGAGEVMVYQVSTTTGSGGGSGSDSTAGRSSLVVKSTDLATANTNGPTDLGNAADTATWSSTTARAFTVYNRGQLDAWAGTTAYALNKQVRSSAGRWYVATVGGTSSSTEPTHTSGTATDGTVTWLYLGTVTSAIYYIADASLSAAQKAAVDARSYLINYHYERKTSPKLTGSTSRYARTKATQTFSYQQIREDCAAQEFAPSAFGTVLGYYDFGALDNVFTASGAQATSGDTVDKVVALAGTAFGDLRQTDATFRPVVQANQINGRATLAYLGVDNNLKMQFPSGRGAIKNQSGLTCVCVFRLASVGVGVNQRIHTILTADGVNRNLLLVDGSNHLYTGGRRQTGSETLTAITGSTALSAGVWYVCMCTYNYSTRAGVIYLNNLSDATGNICGTAGTIDNTDSSADPIIGRDDAGAQDFQGELACWGFFSGVLATQELSALYHYYKTIYGI